MLKVTLSPDDIRSKFPAYGLDIKMALPVAKIQKVNTGGDILESKMYSESYKGFVSEEVLLKAAMQSKFFITLDPTGK